MNKPDCLEPAHLLPQIISEDPDYLVIDKPAGLAVHPGGNIKEKTLTDWLINSYPEISAVGEDPLRPGIVHRLDKEVSGLMVVARNNPAFFNLKDQFKNRTINKEYQALVHGQISNDSGTINFPIARAKSGHKMAALPAGSSDLLVRRHPKQRDQGNIKSWFKSREAATEFTVLKKFVNYTLIRIKIKTGRTHQIRVHFFAYGHPLVGDKLYLNKKNQGKNLKIKLNRVWLVADLLEFTDLKNERKRFEIKLPPELKSSLPKN